MTTLNLDKSSRKVIRWLNKHVDNKNYSKLCHGLHVRQNGLTFATNGIALVAASVIALKDHEGECIDASKVKADTELVELQGTAAQNTNAPRALHSAVKTFQNYPMQAVTYVDTKTLADVLAGFEGCIKIELRGEDKPIQIFAIGPDGARYAALMPMHVKNDADKFTAEDALNALVEIE